VVDFLFAMIEVFLLALTVELPKFRGFSFIYRIVNFMNSTDLVTQYIDIVKSRKALHC